VDLSGANLQGARLTNATGCLLANADLRGANLEQASLNRADLSGAILDGADLTGASLYLCDLSLARLIETIVTHCILDSVTVYGISAWGLIGEPASQKNLRISSPGEAWLSADRIDVAQFLYLLVRNSKLRDVISVLCSKSVLILGRFSEPRKEVLNALADRVRARDMLPHRL
jgi:uncharacterized protein YjbI with pentapeptide repeats